MAKFLKNTTQNRIKHINSGIAFQPGEYQEADDRLLYDEQTISWLNDGTLVFSDDGVTDHSGEIGYQKLTSEAFGINFMSEPERANGFYSKNVQEAIEEARGGAFNNDLDKFQYGRQGTSSNNTYLLTLNNLSSYDSPDTLAYNIHVRRLSVSVSSSLGAEDSFTIRVFKVNPDHSIRTVIWEEEFSIINGNFTGHSGYTDESLIPVDQGWGLYAQVYRYSGTKPADVNLIIWTRQR